MAAGLWAQTPPTTLPPNKVCYGYDAAGNRIGQTPAWITPLYKLDNTINEPLQDCFSDPPETTIPKFLGPVFIIKDLGWLVDIAKDFQIEWVVEVPHLPKDLTSVKNWIAWGNPTQENAGGISVVNDLINSGITNVGVVYDPKGIYDVEFKTFDPNFVERKTIQESADARQINMPTPAVELLIVPNPTYGQFDLKANGFNLEHTQVLILNSLGQVVMQRTYENGAFNISELLSGTYMLIASDGKIKKNISFIKY
jgi:hypothetical protein